MKSRIDQPASRDSESAGVIVADVAYLDRPENKAVRDFCARPDVLALRARILARPEVKRAIRLQNASVRAGR